MSIKASIRLQWARFSRSCANRGPISSAAPWFGTLIGSLLLSVSQGNLWLVVPGVLIAVGGVMPEIAGGYWRSYAEVDYAIQQAREKLLLRWTIEAHREISDRLARRSSIDSRLLSTVADRALEFLAVDVYSDIRGFRAVLYLLSDDGTSLDPAWQSGREDQARSFVAGTPRGDSALIAATRAGYVYSDDITKRPYRWGGTGNGYRSFVSVPLILDGVGLGMLTVDAPEVGALSEHDGPLLEGVGTVFERLLTHLRGSPIAKVEPSTGACPTLGKMVKLILKGRWSHEREAR